MQSFLILLVSCLSCFCYAVDPLPSWNDGENKTAILNFVSRVTDQNRPDFVPVVDRIATFDQDGTLWVEHPVYTQMVFALDRLKELAEEKDSKAEKLLNQFVSDGTDKISEPQIEELVALTHAGMSVQEYLVLVDKWLKTAVHPRFKKPYTSLVYQPMLEVIELFRKNEFKIYIVSGGGQDFIRAYSQKVYGIPVENVIGTAGKVNYEVVKGEPTLIKLPELLFNDNYKGKPEAIHLFIGKRPLAAFGNSDGDEEMLESAKALSFLIHHDDPEREYAYGPDTKVGTFSNALMKKAKERKWGIVSMKNDWKVIFPKGDR